MSHEFKSDLLLPAATTSVPSLNVPHGTAPSSPTNGDIWTTSTGIYARINGTTNQLDATGGTHDHDNDYLAVAGPKLLTVGTTAPSSPSTGDLWLDTN